MAKMSVQKAGIALTAIRKNGSPNDAALRRIAMPVAGAVDSINS